MVEVFRAVRRVMRDDACAWVNMGDTFQNKQLLGMPWRLAFALQADGWWLRSEIIWAKPNPMPESCTDRPTKAHEQIFLLTKRARYFYDAEAVREEGHDWGQRERKEGSAFVNGTPGRSRQYGGTNCDFSSGRNRRTVWTAEPTLVQQFLAWKRARNGDKPDVWTVATHAFSAAHFATFPPALIEPCILAGTSEKGACPKCGSPWRRVVEKERKPTRPAENNVNDPTGMANRDPQRHVTDTITTGWQSTCECGGEPVPCVCLDPFFGAGTTGLVCQRLGRDWIGIELNPEYAAMALKRIRGDAPLFSGAAVETVPSTRPPREQGETELQE